MKFVSQKLTFSPRFLSEDTEAEVQLQRHSVIRCLEVEVLNDSTAVQQYFSRRCLRPRLQRDFQNNINLCATGGVGLLRLRAHRHTRRETVTKTRQQRRTNKPTTIQQHRRHSHRKLIDRREESHWHRQCQIKVANLTQKTRRVHNLIFCETDVFSD